jgi:benzoylformate decarboxylase
MLARDFVLETFKQYGVEYLFGNPGTTELPLIDGLVNYPDIQFLIALHEDIVVGMAAGYAQATGKPGVVNLHVAPGLAHGLGNVYDAYRAGVPLIVTAGQQDTRLAVQEPALWGDMITMARSFTKWCWEVKRAEELPFVLQRAFKVAMTEPMGPVFISLPSDVMWREIDASPIPLTVIGKEIRGDQKLIRAAAEAIRQAKNPVFVAGDRVGRTEGAIEALVGLAEKLGVPVYQEHQSSSLNFPYVHSNFAGRFLPNGPAIHEALKEADVAVFLGVISQAPLLYFDKPLIQPGTKVIAVDQSEWEIGKNNHVDYPIYANLKTVLQEWEAWLTAQITSEEQQQFAARQAKLVEHKAEREERKRKELDESRGKMPLSPAVVMDEINRYLTDDVLVVDESVTTGRYVHSYLQLKRAGSLIGLKGGGLGYGMPAALGAQLGRPDERVLAVIGDGSAYYYIQSLWNAAKYNLPVIFVIANNTSYMILKGGLLSLNGESAKKGVYPGMDLDGPDVNLVEVASGFGIEALRIETYDQLREGVAQAFAEKRPILLDVVIDRTVKPFLA